MELCAGDFYSDDLPRGADLAWVSAIIHQNSPEQNRALYGRIAAALDPQGWIYIRDIVMEPSRTAPVAGALFAVNMLSATEGGNSYSLAEIQDDLQSAGFTDVQLVRRDEGMHSIVRAPAHAQPSTTTSSTRRAADFEVRPRNPATVARNQRWLFLPDPVQKPVAAQQEFTVAHGYRRCIENTAVPFQIVVRQQRELGLGWQHIRSVSRDSRRRSSHPPTAARRRRGPSPA